MKIKNYFLLPIVVLVFVSANLYGQSTTKIPKKNLMVAFYNVENLFDTIDNPNKIDNEFLPNGKKEWNSIRYWDKVDKLAQVLSSLSDQKLPDIIGLCEIENQAVVEDLAKSPALKKAKYTIVHYESPDARGIDVALLVAKKKQKVLYTRPILVHLPQDKRFKTRDILYVKVYNKQAKDTVHIFVNHWPSRRGGMKKSAHKRKAAALALKTVTDSLQNQNPKVNIIIMGDFNDETDNESIMQVLNALPPIENPKNNKPTLTNLAFELDSKGKGSYYYSYKKQWNMLDQIIISNHMLQPSASIRALSTQQQIFQADWLLYTSKSGVKSPARTYGRSYYGGYSDHFAVFQYFIF
jgi:predicted extracellular nuclease